MRDGIFFSLIDTPRVLEGSVVCGFHLLNRKEKEAGTDQVTSTISLRYPGISPGAQKVKLLVG